MRPSQCEVVTRLLSGGPVEFEDLRRRLNEAGGWRLNGEQFGYLMRSLEDLGYVESRREAPSWAQQFSLPTTN